LGEREDGMKTGTWVIVGDESASAELMEYSGRACVSIGSALCLEFPDLSAAEGRLLDMLAAVRAEREKARESAAQVERP
jgi:hypothetical protein